MNCDWTRLRKARKQHSCCECNKTIQKDEQYSYSSGVFEDTPYSHKMCGYCADLVRIACILARKIDYQDEHYPEFCGLNDFRQNFKFNYGLPIEQAICQL